MANLSEQLFRRADEQGGKLALVFGPQTISYADLAARVRQAGAGLAAAGVGIGHKVGLMMEARPDFIILQQALFALGAVVSPLNIFYTRHELASAIDGCELDFLIVSPAFAGLLPTPGGSSVKQAFVLDLPLAQESGFVVSADRLMMAPAAADLPRSLPAEALGLLLNTSATTGKAKGVMLSIGNIQANYDPTPGWLGLTPDSVILCALPLYNTFGLNQCINATFVLGATLVLLPKFDAEKCLAAIAEWRCSFFPAVPTMLQKLVDHPERARHDLTSIMRIMTGAAPVPAALLERIYAVMGQDTRVMTGYGLTEGTALITLDHIELDAEGRVSRPKSIGRVLPGMEIRIARDDGSEADPGEVGQILVRGPNVMQGYYKMPEVTARTIVDGWLHTGDLGYLGESDCYFIVDRMKDLIIRGGQNVYPAEIEEAIYHYPGVREVAVVGKADPVLGEVPVAFVAHAPDQPIDGADLMAFCRERMAYFKVPSQLYFRNELPKGPTGKILRRELRATLA